MKAKVISTLAMCLFAGAALNVNADDDHDRGRDHQSKQRLVLQLLGTGNMYESTVPDIDGDSIDDPAMCFDLSLIDFSTNKVIGTGSDCFANVTPIGSGISVDATMYLNMHQGTLILRTKSSAQPVLRETLKSDTGQAYTHIAGASDNKNGIVGGTGRFTGSTGTVRFNGMLDMSKFEGMVGDPVLIDCVFVINLD